MKNKIKSLQFVGFAALVVLLFAISLTACSDDDNGSFTPTPNQSGDDDVVDDTDDGDTGEDADTGDNGEHGDLCDDVDCGEGQVCSEGDCYEQTSEGYGCALPYELGSLSPGDQLTQIADPRQEPNVVNTQCSVDDESSQAVFSFSVDETVEVDIDVALTDEDLLHTLARDVRVGSCNDHTASQMCETDDTGEPMSLFAEPGNDYFVIVEARQGTQIAELELDISAREVACFPANSWSCDGDDLVHCRAAEEEVAYQCADGCFDDECGGDSCTNAIEVQASTTVSADLAAYSSNFDFNNDSANCSSSGDGIATSGEDIVFRLPGLSAGDTVEVTRPDTSYAIGVMDECSQSAPSCLYGHSSGTDFEWEVEAAGDYYLVVNRYSPIGSDSEVEFGIDIN